MNRIQSIIIGVRITPLFQMVDNAGMIFDKLLKDNKAFSRKVFSNVHYGGLEKMLYQDDKNEITNYLKISSDNVILSFKMDKNSNISDMINNIRKKFEGSVVPATLNEYKATINRLGIVFVSDINDDELNRFKAKYFAKGVDVAEFRFSRSSGLLSGAKYVEGADYSNRIFSLAKNEDGTKRLTFDYQQYFYPLRPSWIDCKPEVFFDSAISEVTNEILSL